MRNLTITRAKRFVACLGAYKVYIEDANGETKIGDSRCRLLGKLKNGATVTFEIGEEEARIYVIADQLSKGFCNECLTLPAGAEDILLTGAAQFNPASGNAFRFDGVANEETLANRKKATGAGLIILIFACAIGLVLGCFIGGLIV